MENTETADLLTLKEKVDVAVDKDDQKLQHLYQEARECVIKRMEVLVASGVVETHDFDEVVRRLEGHGKKDFPRWRRDALHSIDLCLKKYADYERVKKEAPLDFACPSTGTPK